MSIQRVLKGERATNVTAQQTSEIQGLYLIIIIIIIIIMDYFYLFGAMSGNNSDSIN
jgi:hypothetical protein